MSQRPIYYKIHTALENQPEQKLIKNKERRNKKIMTFCCNHIRRAHELIESAENKIGSIDFPFSFVAATAGNGLSFNGPEIKEILSQAKQEIASCSCAERRQRTVDLIHESQNAITSFSNQNSSLQNRLRATEEKFVKGRYLKLNCIKTRKHV